MENSINKNLSNLKKLFTKADIILIILLLVFAIVVSITLLNKRNEKIVEIRQDNELIRRCKLDKDEIIKIDEQIIIEIKNGKVRMKSSSCKNKLCVKQGWSSYFPIICVPNKISIVIRSKKEEMLITR